MDIGGHRLAMCHFVAHLYSFHLVCNSKWEQKGAKVKMRLEKFCFMKQNQDLREISALPYFTNCYFLETLSIPVKKTLYHRTSEIF